MLARGCFASILVAVLAASRPVAALDEGQWQASLSAGYARLWADGHGLNALESSLAGRYGLSDDLSLRCSLGGAWHPQGGGVGPVRAGTVGVGAIYAWDVLRVIPFIDAGLGLVLTSGAGVHDEQALGAEVSLGAEYFLDRQWTLAGLGRFSVSPLRLGGTNVVNHPSALSLSLRLGRAF